jgi:hypothetical protein
VAGGFVLKAGSAELSALRADNDAVRDEILVERSRDPASPAADSGGS